MKNSIRNILDKSFTLICKVSLAIVAMLAFVFIVPIAIKGMGAVVFKATSEHEKFLLENLDYDLSGKDVLRIKQSDAEKQKLFKMLSDYENGDSSKSEFELLGKKLKEAFENASTNKGELKKALNLKASSRAESISKISEKIFANYIGEISRLTKLENISIMQFESELNNQLVLLEENANAFAEKFSKENKLSILKKGAIRRNIIDCPKENIQKCIEKVERRNEAYISFKEGLCKVFGPLSKVEKDNAKIMRQKYGQTRLDNARNVFNDYVKFISITEIDKESGASQKIVKSKEYFKGSDVEKIYDYVEKNFDKMLSVHWAVYLGFFTDNPVDANIFGGIFPAIMGTVYLTILSMLIAAPLGIAAAIYFSEYSKENALNEILKMCVGTLAGVPSVVFGLFGLAFLINTIKISDSKSVLAGGITLALLILPTIIRACQEALKAVPNSYREAALGLGAGKWTAIRQVILPAAFPSMLTGIIISMGRAAGETAPIIFTAATSTGLALGVFEIFSQPTQALPWSIYNICSEHELAERVEHVQYAMALTLMAIVLMLNLSAIILRAKLSKFTLNK